MVARAARRESERERERERARGRAVETKEAGASQFCSSAAKNESFLVRDKSLTHKFRIITAAKIVASTGPSEKQIERERERRKEA